MSSISALKVVPPPPPPRLGLWVWGFGVLVCCCIHQSSSFTSEENVASFSTCVTPAPCFIPSLFVFRQRGVKPLKLGRAAAAAGVSSWLPAPLLLPSSTQMSSLFPLKKIEMSRCVCVCVCVCTRRWNCLQVYLGEENVGVKEGILGVQECRETRDGSGSGF